MKNKLLHKIFFSFLIFTLPFSASAFGVLSHQAIIDALWESSILPLLKAKYPASTADQIKEARAYAYGGTVAPDMGYYPLGSTFFTNLVHYVRSGNMITSLLRNANTINQYAFAIGFMSHYYADNYGHPIATNKSVPLVYPKLGKKHGDEVTYADDNISHMRMEFGFDVLQVAKGNFATEKFHEVIGFKVDTTVLAKAFLETYGLDINGVFKNRFSTAVEFFRWTVANILPFITKTAWATKGNDIIKVDSTATSKHFRIRMRQKDYNKQYGTGYRQPGFFPTIVSFFIRVMPKVGPLRPLKFKMPTAEAEKYYIESFDMITRNFSTNLNKINQGLNLQDLDLDTGKPTVLCEYSLADLTYDKWLLQLKDDDFRNITNPQKLDIISFYSLGNNPIDNQSNKCSEVREAYNQLINFRLNK